MRLIPPSKFTVYRGADISSAYDATGALYWACTAEYPDSRFGVVILKQIGENPSTVVTELPVLCSRGTISDDGRITAWGDDKHPSGYTFAIPGFKPIGAGTAVPVQMTNVNAPDSEARSQAAQALSAAQNALKKAQEAFAQSATALTIANKAPSLDVVWQKALDAVEAVIINAEKDANQHFSRFVWQKALDAAYSLLKERGIIKQ